LDQLSGMPATLALPYDYAPEGARDFAGATESLALSAGVTAELRRLAVRKRTTLSNVVLALFKLVLFRWTRQSDICVGIGVANRNHPDLENLIGFFVNLVPIRSRLSSEMDFDELLSLTIERTRDALDHQEYPFDLMIRKLNPARQANRQPLLNVMYGFESAADSRAGYATHQAGSSGAAGSSEPIPKWDAFEVSLQISKFDLTLLSNEQGDALRLTLEYDQSLFLASTIQEQARTLAQFAELVAQSEMERNGQDHGAARQVEYGTA
jgi:non-ribosomal peptide synthetase component F